MKRNITISPISKVQRLSMSMREALAGMKTVTMFERCLRIWNQNISDDEANHLVPLGYQHLPRSGRHQFRNCLAPN